ncbi:MAG: cache domain-containing protein [Syntrophobacteraceae bacterium]
MKRAGLVLACVGFLFVSCLGFAVAQEKASRDECVAKCKEAAALIKEVGVEAAMAKIQDAKGPFVWKDSYVYASDLDGKVLAHPMAPGLVGKALRGLKDPTGKMFGSEILDVANNAGEGWVEYMWPKPNEQAPSHKATFVYRVPGQSVYVAAGIYED